MQRLMHSLATVWIYLNRDSYRKKLRAEYDNLCEQEESATDLATRIRLRRRRAMVAEEIHGLMLPFRLRSLWAPLPVLTHRIADVMEAQQQDYVEAA